MIHIRRPSPDEVTARLRLLYLDAKRAERFCLRRLTVLVDDGAHHFAAAYMQECATYQQHYAEALAIVLNPPQRRRSA